MKKFLKAATLVLIAAAVCISAFLCGCSDKNSYRWAKKIIRKYYYEDIDKYAPFNGSLKDFVSENLDRYSAYYTAEEYEAVMSSNAGKKSGLGVNATFINKNSHPDKLGNGIFIERVIGNSPAYFAGIERGELITAVEEDGRVIEFSDRKAYNQYFADVENGKQITLYCDRHEQGHTVALEDYTASYCSMQTAQCSYNVTYKKGNMIVEESGDGNSNLPNGAAYLRIDQFYGKAADEAANLLRQYNSLGCTSLILDLRGNGGGYVAVMQEIAGLFVGQIEGYMPNAMYAEYKKGKKEKYPVKDNYGADYNLPEGAKVSVLADNGTASASEALIGVLVCNGVISYSDVYLSDFSEEYLSYSNTAQKNCKTYGKGIMQSTYVNKYTGEALKLTTARILWPDATTGIHDKGLTVSDGCKTVKADWSITYNDRSLTQAINLIYG